jgi:hypothetical protein
LFVQIWPTWWSPRWIPAALGVSIFVGGLFWGNRRNSQHEDRAPLVPQQIVYQYFGSSPTQAVAPAASTVEKPTPISRDIELSERDICEKVEAEIKIAVREAGSAPKSKKHRAAINTNINREHMQRSDVL